MSLTIPLMKQHFHVLSRTWEYTEWVKMRRRCYDSGHPSNKWYRSAGIKVCRKWLYNAEAFVTYLRENLPSKPKGFSLDRIDNKKNYEPGNLRWATHAEQQSNKRNNRYYTFQGQRKTIDQWARALGMSKNTLHTRLTVQKLDCATAATRPLSQRCKPKNQRA